MSLADQYVRAIRAGSLGPGDRLPPHRSLAYDLGLSVQTVSRAYRELIRRGLISGEVGRGSFVLPPAAESAPPYLAERPSEIVDLSILKPVSEPMHLQLLRDGLHWVADHMAAPAALSFRPSSIMPVHRRIAADWLARGGVEASPDSIVITDGATSAVTTAVMAAVVPGGTLAAEALTHHLLMPLCQYLGVSLEGLAMDGEGLLPEALDQAARRGAVRAVYLQPAAINPLAILMPPARRAEIVEVARRHDLAIIENDMLNAMIAPRPAPFAALAPERVFHINGFTKSTLPGLRLAYLTVPERFAAAAANRHLVTNWVATPVMVELLSHWITDGTVDELIRWQRAALAGRQALAAEVLAGVPFRSHPQALHLWLDLPPGRREDEFVTQARLRGVAIASGRAFRLGEGSGPAVRIALGATRAEDLRRGLGVVAEMLRSEPAEALLPLF
nr:PLP-dependent aminotransferase family protein [Paracoccus sp. S-4012]